MADFHDSLDRALEHTSATLTENEIELREWLRSQPGGAGRWTIIKAGFRRSYDMGARDARASVRALAEDLRGRTTDHIAGGRGVPYYSGPWVTRELEKLLKGGA